MLVVERKPGQGIIITPADQPDTDTPVRVWVTAVRGHKVKIAIDAPHSLTVLRTELVAQPQRGSCPYPRRKAGPRGSGPSP